MMRWSLIKLILPVAMILCMLPSIGFAGEVDWQPLLLSKTDITEFARVEADIAERAQMWDGHDIPTKEQVSLQEAVSMANRALITQKGITEDDLKEFTVMPYFLSGETYAGVNVEYMELKGPHWQLTYLGSQYFSVKINADTGGVFSILGEEDTNE